MNRPYLIAIALLLLLLAFFGWGWYSSAQKTDYVQTAFSQQESAYQQKIQQDSIAIYNAGKIAGKIEANKDHARQDSLDKHLTKNIKPRYEKAATNPVPAVDSLTRYFAEYKSVYTR